MRCDKGKPGYFSYLLRLWETEDEGRRVWRVSLELPATGERYGFASLPELFAFLEEKTGEERPLPAESQTD
ncbi:MAG: hypothetical protein H6667_03960 [Ardenticatenaceae bacterium]|nr:hypothetical protein [Ardenticatenaceae bacterium]MCB9446637.1 hypothetical protein [Ardenticatenaceae bacterium]